MNTEIMEGIQWKEYIAESGCECFEPAERKNCVKCE